MESWPEYVRRVAGGMTQAQIAARAGVSTSAAGSWVRGDPGQPDATKVIAFAKGFGQPPVEALIVAGYLDAGAAPDRTPLAAYSMGELLDELRRRTIDG